VSIWRAVENLFIPWNLIRSSDADEREGTRSVDYGQLLIVGATGDIADITRIVGQGEAPHLPATTTGPNPAIDSNHP
jgi:hypothetical protein